MNGAMLALCWLPPCALVSAGDLPAEPAVRARWFPLLLLLFASGCAHSRWALSDDEYYAKYGGPAERNVGFGRKLKQASDARFMAGRTGAYLGAGAQSNAQVGPPTVGGEAGLFHYVNHSLESHGGLSLLSGTGDNDVFLGGNLGARLQAPSRLAPFVGLGTFAGNSQDVASGENDDIDNDDDGSTDEDGEQKVVRSDWLAAVYPEVGVHFWLGPRLRLTASASYYVTTAGRDTDFAMFGLNLGFLPRSERAVPVETIVEPTTVEPALEDLAPQSTANRTDPAPATAYVGSAPKIAPLVAGSTFENPTFDPSLHAPPFDPPGVPRPTVWVSESYTR